MNTTELFNFKKTHKLFGLNKDFDFLKSLHNLNKFPRALLISGKKGEGKSTMINHLMYYIFDRENYDSQDNIFSDIIEIGKTNVARNQVRFIKRRARIIGPNGM